MGILSTQPSYRGGPIHVLHPVAYVGAGILAATGIAAALFDRERTGRGRRVATSLMSGALLYSFKAEWDDMPPPRPMVQTPRGAGPFYSVYECSDGQWLQLGCIHSGFVDRAAPVLGLSDLIASTPEFGEGRAPTSEEARQRLFDAVADSIKTRPSDYWFNALENADVPCGVCRTPEEAMMDPQVVHSRLVEEVDDPLFGPTTILGVPIRLSKTSGCIRAPRATEPISLDGLSSDSSNRADSPLVEGAESPGHLPLSGVRVMEMTNVIAGPVAGRLLGDLGADVTKFESLAGDISRSSSPGFVAFNSSKKGVAADAKTDDGKGIAQRLAASADVMLANMRPGATDRIGLDAATLTAINPALVQMHITAYGWDGPYSRRPGLDPIAQAITGLQFAQGGYSGSPVYLGALAPCDFTGGALGALGAVLGLLARERFGVAQKVDTSLLAAAAIVNGAGFVSYAGKPPRSLPDSDQYGLSPRRRLYETSDGWIYVAADSPEVKGRFKRAIADRLGKRSPDSEELDRLFRESTSEVAIKTLKTHRVPCAPVIEDYSTGFFSDPQADANRMLAEVHHPTLGTVRLNGNLVSFEGADSLPRLPAPLHGEHTAEALSELGYSPNEISRLYETGVVTTESPE